MSDRAALELEPGTPTRPRAPVPFVQRRADSAGPSVAAPESVQRTLSSPGRPLDAGTRDFMESRFGHDFGKVRIHNDGQAGQSARDIHAHAYTSGDHIAFAPGKYQPESHSGRELLAHELAHTVQQGGLQRRGSDLAVDTEPGSRLEHEADAAARSVMHGSGAPCIAGRPAGPVISREPDGEGPPANLPKGAVSITNEVSGLGTCQHTVMPDGPLPPKAKSARVRKFKADPFYLPGTKGEGAEKIYSDYVAAGELRTVIGFNETGGPRSELWQARDRTAVLGDSWLQLMRWPEAEKDTRWQTVTGETGTFPKVAGATAQIDHIVELQLGGTNNPSNLRALDPDPNQKSGSHIWLEVSALAKAVRDEPTFAVSPEDQIQLSFTSVKPKGEVWSGDYSKKPMSALKAHMKALAERGELAADATTKYIRVAAGANIDDFAVPADWSKAKPVADLDAFPFNKAPAQLVSSMLFRKITYISSVGIWVDAEFDLRNRTRIPLGTKADAAAKGNPLFKLSGGRANAKEPFKLALNKVPAGLGFDYPFLSPVTMVPGTVKLNDSGDLDWDAKLETKFAPLNPLGLQYRQGSLKVTKGIDKAELEKRKLLGFKITDARIALQLAPTFSLDARFDFAMGSGEKPLVKGYVSLEPDGTLGIKGTGNIELNLPKVKSASSTIQYTGGGGRADDWKLKLSVESEGITLAPGYTLTGKVDAFVEGGELKFAGEFTASLPGGNSATLGLRRSPKGSWQLHGGGKFKVPRSTATVAVNATYDLDTQLLWAEVKTATPFNITLGGVKFSGSLDYLKIVITGEGKVAITGSGTVGFEKGKAKGDLTLTLEEGGWFKGSGSVTYKLRPDLTLTGTVTYTERPKQGEPRMRVGGKLELAELKLFEAKKDEKKLIGVEATIPIPGLSVGTSGVVINIGGKLVAGYSFGPGVIKPVTFSAEFNPLDENPDLSLGVTGRVSLPASAYVKASVNAELAVQVDAFIAKGGAAAGLELSGTIQLSGEAFAELTASYAKGKLDATVKAGVKAALDLGFALTAYVRVYAESIIGLDAEERIDWVLAQKSLPTGLTVIVSAPFKYNSDDGFTWPEKIDIERPEIDAKDTVNKLLARGSGKKTKA